MKEMKPLKQAYIGKNITITESTNETLKGITGKIIDETKNTFKIKTKNETKTILKNVITFKIDEQEIKGKNIQKKSYDRIKIKGEK